ncbi:MAG: efflux RND transporter periplasmic adaptor subunit [Alphaproteobacteria bacterium]
MRTWIYAAIAVVLSIAFGFVMDQSLGLWAEGDSSEIASEQNSGIARKSTAQNESRILYYRDPMGRGETSPVPKKDAMGMDYVPVYADEAGGRPGIIRVSQEKIQRAGVRTDVVKRMILAKTVRAAGTVVPDETKLAIITMKFSGFVEELYVSTTGAQVRAGQPLMKVWIESPEVLAKEVDYVVALGGSAAGIAQAANNLRLFGIPESAIAEMRQTRRAARSVTIEAPIDGTILEKPAVVGMHFAAGDVLFRSADLSTVWVLAHASERDLPFLLQGQTAKIAFPDNPEMTFQGEVAFVYPELDAATRTAQVRIVVANPDGRIRAGQYADVTINAATDNFAVLAVPESAILDSGSRQIAFVAKENGVFEPRALQPGRRGAGYVEVREGLREGERIVISGNFLIDAESNLQTALGAIAPGTPQ